MDYEWFRTRKSELGLTDQQVASVAGRERSVITKVFGGTGTFDPSKADQLSTLFETSRLELLMRIGVLRPSDIALASTADHSDDQVAEITALDLSLSMGPGTLIEEFVEAEPVKLGLALVQAITRTPTDRLRLVRGIGDSMEPTLRTGDRVLVDINERHLTRINGIYWIDHSGAHGIKRLRPASSGRLVIGSDNPDVPDYEADASEVRIEGRVIWFARDL